MKLALGITLGAFLGVSTAFLMVHAGASVLPPAHAQTVSGDGGNTGAAVVVGTGGSMPNLNDICWILFREKAKDREGKEFERTSLCLYKAMNNGGAFDLVDSREITYDGKLVQLNHKEHKAELTPQTLKEKWEAAKKKEEEQREREERERRARNR